MNQHLKSRILQLYPEYKTIYGPYIRKSDQRQIIILYDGVKRSARLLAKVTLEAKLGKRLNRGEEVDHIDHNSQNDSENNLQLLIKVDNVNKELERKYGSRTERFCLECSMSLGFKYRHNRKYCSNSCKQIHLGANQYGNKLDGYSPLGETGQTHST